MYRELKALQNIIDLKKKREELRNIEGQLRQDAQHKKDSVYAEAQAKQDKLKQILQTIDDFSLGEFNISYSPLTIQNMNLKGIHVAVSPTEAMEFQLSYGKSFLTPLYIFKDWKNLSRKDLFQNTVTTGQLGYHFGKASVYFTLAGFRGFDDRYPKPELPKKIRRNYVTGILFRHEISDNLLLEMETAKIKPRKI